MDEEECGFFPEENTKEINKTEDIEVSFPLSDSNTCKYCASVPLNAEILKIFNINVCKECGYKKLKFITKTTANKEYLLSNEDIKNLKYISRPNPHKGTWHDMQLYLLDEILEICLSKYGTLEKIEEIKMERENTNKKRKIKKLKTKIRDLKRRTIISQESIVKHVHDFEGEGTTKKCTTCGITIEQEEI